MNPIIPLISLGNESTVVAAEAIKPGVLALANEARTTASAYSEPLTQFLAGWRDQENIQATLDFIAPPVQVGLRFEFKKADNTEVYLSEVDDERAIGSGFKRIEYKGTTANEKTFNRGLTYRLDIDEEGGVVSEETIVARIMARIQRNKLRRAITALLALDAGTNKTWNASAQPDEDIRAAIAAAQLASGTFPNRALIGMVAWNLRASAYSSQDNAGSAASYGLTPTQCAQRLGLDDMKVSRELYQSSATAKTRIMTSNVVLFNAQNGLGKDDPSNLKQFYTPAGGGMYRVYRQEVDGKFIDITVEHYDRIVATSTIGAAKLNIS